MSRPPHSIEQFKKQMQFDLGFCLMPSDINEQPIFGKIYLDH